MVTVKRSCEKIRFPCKVRILTLQNKLNATIRLDSGLRIADVFAVRLINGTYYGKAIINQQSFKLCSDDCRTWFLK